MGKEDPQRTEDLNQDTAQAGEIRESSGHGLTEGPEDERDRSTPSEAQELQNRLDHLKFQVKRYDLINNNKQESAEANRLLHEATFRATEAEFGVRNAELEVALAQVQSRKLKTDEEVQALDEMRLLLESQIRSLQANRDEHTRELQASNEVASHLEDEGKQLEASLEVLRKKSRSQAKRLSNIQDEIDTKLADADLQAQAKLKEADSRAQTAITATEQDARVLKKAAATQQAQQSLKAEAELAKWEKDKKKEFDSGLKRKLSTLDRRLSESLFDDLYETLEIKLSQPDEERVTRQLKHRLTIVLGGTLPAANSDVTRHYKYDDAMAMLRTKRFRLMACGLILGIAAVLAGAYFSDSTKPRAPEQTATELFIDKVQQSRSDARFHTQKQPNIKEAYWASVLYTENYVDRITDDVYEQTWVVALNRWLIDQRQLGDRTVVAVIPAEKRLLRDLVEMAEHLRSDEVEVGIERMKDRERTFEAELARTFGTEENVKAFYSFRQDFFVQYVAKP